MRNLHIGIIAVMMVNLFYGWEHRSQKRISSEQIRIPIAQFHPFGRTSFKSGLTLLKDLVLLSWCRQ